MNYDAMLSMRWWDASASGYVCKSFLSLPRSLSFFLQYALRYCIVNDDAKIAQHLGVYVCITILYCSPWCFIINFNMVSLITRLYRWILYCECRCLDWKAFQCLCIPFSLSLFRSMVVSLSLFLPSLVFNFSLYVLLSSFRVCSSFSPSFSPRWILFK